MTTCNERFDPWATALDPHSELALSAFWRQRLDRLRTLPVRRPAISGARKTILWSFLAISLLMPRLHLATSAHADELVTKPPSQPNQVNMQAAFPHVIDFKRGANRFEGRDNISITEVRGTAKSMKPGNIYWIKGKYTLASRERATILASVTADNVADGKGKTLKVQKTKVDKGEGTFMLYLPMYYDGWPHVSFYPERGGDGFGESYFGTGDTVLENGWWE
jgi:hypothetical protein